MKILFLTPWFPYPPDNGIRIRLFNLLRAIGKRHTVTVLSFLREDDRFQPEKLKDFCHSIQTVPWHSFNPKRAKSILGFFLPIPRSQVDTYSSEMAQLVANFDLHRPFDLVIASTIDTAEYAIRAPARFRMLEEHNSMTRWMQDNYRGQHRLLPRLRAWLTYRKYRHYESRLYSRFDACTMVSELDARAARELLGYCKPLAVIPNAMDLDYYQPNYQPEPNTLIFNGSLTYDANLDAMRYFSKEIWLQIRAYASDVTLKITGYVNGLQGDAFGDGISLTGYLDDIRPVVGQAWACVVPLRSGSGTRLKILEAMALGTPVVSTTKGAEGLDVSHGENILLADTPNEFAAQTVALLRDAGLRERLAQHARKLVETRYNWENSGKLFNEFLCVQFENRTWHI
jgi:glycosyltransferase involved in cell wall biosynthesis